MRWSKQSTLDRIRTVGLLPVIRLPSCEQAMRAAEAIVGGGVGIVEITMNVPDAVAIIERLARQHGSEVLIGAGTVLDAEMCHVAINAGAQFVVTPSLIPRVIDAARAADALCISGALTPTEILNTHQAGADLVKVFPCAPVGGARYIRALRGPFPHIPLLPTGGIAADAVPEFIAAGVVAVGLGGAELLDLESLDRGDSAPTHRKLRAVLDGIQSARTALQKRQSPRTDRHDP